jgi:anti-sigma factor RsiW
MSAAIDTKDCIRLERWLTAYVDDELDAVHILEVESHLDSCDVCREQTVLARSVRASLRHAARFDASIKAPSALRDRICAVMVAERKHEATTMETAVRTPKAAAASASKPARGDEDDGVAGGWLGTSRTGGNTPRLVRLRYVMPLAAIATVALVIGSNHLRVQKEREAAAHNSAQHAKAAYASTFDRFIDDLVETHMQPPPPEVTDYDSLDRFNPSVGVRIPHPELKEIGARYLGARMHRRDAAMLQYQLGDRRRVTLYVFDPARVPVQANRLQPRVVGNNHLYVGRIRGYSVAASEHAGVGYALASDLSDKETEQAIMMAAR